MSEVVVLSQQTNQVVIEEENNTVIVEVPVASVVTIVEQGPQGPAGSGAYIHTQSAASTTWTINHNMGFRPSVELLDSGSQEIDGEISHPTINQTIVRLNPASTGIARLT